MEQKGGNRFDPENQSAVKTYLLLEIDIYPTMNWVSIGRAALSGGPIVPKRS